MINGRSKIMIGSDVTTWMTAINAATDFTEIGVKVGKCKKQTARAGERVT